jgi:hypothetical protein
MHIRTTKRRRCKSKLRNEKREEKRKRKFLHIQIIQVSGQSYKNLSDSTRVCYKYCVLSPSSHHFLRTTSKARYISKRLRKKSIENTQIRGKIPNKHPAFAYNEHPPSNNEN